MRVWRIGTTTRDYPAHDMSGRGAEVTGGRWNSKGLPVVYCASSVSLACLETLVHFNGAELPLNRYIIAIDIPSVVWARRKRMTAQTLPTTWDAVPAAVASVTFGDEWCKECKQAVLEVPSAIIGHDMNFVINPRHLDAQLIQATPGEKFLYDHRLIKWPTSNFANLP